MNETKKTKADKPVIRKVWIEKAVDDTPDTSYLGEYANKPASPWSIDRKARGDQEHGEFRYWNPSSNHCPPGEGESWSHVSDEDVRVALTVAGLAPCADRLDAITRLDLHYVEQDYKRMESYNHGDWCYLGFIAKAEVQLRRNGVIQVVHSGGLWGIESDSGDDYFDEVKKEQLAELAQELRLMGFGERAVKYACDHAEEKETF